MSNSSGRSKHRKDKNLSTLCDRSEWSEWILDEQRELRWRWRYNNGEGRYEYDYDKQAYDSQQSTVTVPRTPRPDYLEPICQVPVEQHYTHDQALSSVTNRLAQTSLASNSTPVSLVSNSTTVDVSYTGQRNVVRTSNPYTNNEEFDPAYQVHQSGEFKWGRVFKTLWTEPKDNGGESSTIETQSVRRGAFGESYSSKVRRFLIIKEEKGHCICLPILTYGSQGTNKRGVHAKHHAIIYTEQPVMFHGEGERGLTKKAIRVIPSEPQHKLDPASRLNYGKVYTVEYNVKVLFIGRLAPESEQQVLIDSNSVNPMLSRPQGGPTTNRKESSKKAHDLTTQWTPWEWDSRGFWASSRLNFYGEQEWKYEGAPTELLPIPTIYTDSSHYNTSSTSATGCESLIGKLAQESEQQAITDYNIVNSLKSLPQGGPTTDRKEFSNNFEPVISLNVRRNPLLSSVSSELPTSSSGKSNSLDMSKMGHSSADLPPQNSEFTPNSNSTTITQGMLTPLHDMVHDFGTFRTSFQGSREQHIRRQLSSASITSVESALFSATSEASSLSSLGDNQASSDVLIGLLLSDGELKQLYGQASKKISLYKFENNFRRCLVQFSQHLKTESLTPQFRGAARYVKYNSNKLASQLRRKLDEITDKAGLNTPNIVLEQTIERSHEDDYEDDHDDDYDDKDIDDYAFSELMEAIQHSNSWQFLRENLNIFLHPNRRKRALFTIWPIVRSLDSPHEIQYIITWEAPQFLRLRFPDIQSIANILMITMNSDVAVAQTCKEYLEGTWPEVGAYVLEAVDKFLQTYEENIAVAIRKESLVIRLEKCHGNERESQISALVTSSYHMHEKIIAALSWLCSALRPSPGDTIYQSSVEVQCSPKNLKDEGRDISKSANITLELNILQEFPKEFNFDCWRNLFPGMVIAYGFPVKERIEGKGLEISFADMAMAARVLSLVEFDGGLIGNGLSTVLVPVKELTEDNAIQWHFSDKKIKGSRGRLHFSDILGDIDKWHKEPIADRLIERRCFLGWTLEASIVLGTEDFSGEDIDFSQTTHGPEARYVRSYGLTFGTGGMGYLAATGTTNWQKTSVLPFVQNRIEKNIYDKIEDCWNDNVLVYDAGKKVAYYLPQSAFVLFTARTILTRRGYQLVNDGVATHFHMAQPCSEGGHQAYQALKANLRFKVKKQDSSDGLSDEGVSKLFGEIWHTLDNIQEELLSAEKEFSKVKEHAPKFIHGVEYLDILKLKHTMQINRAEVNQPWACLTKHDCPIIFCSGLPQPIVPLRLDQICSPWRMVPSGRNALVATCYTIREFLKRTQNGLCANVEWDDAERLIEFHKLHNNDKITSINHIQRLRFLRWGSPKANARLREKIELHLPGGLIFDTEHQPCLCRLEFTQVPRVDRYEGKRIKGKGSIPVDSRSGRATIDFEQIDGGGDGPHVGSRSDSSSHDLDHGVGCADDHLESLSNTQKERSLVSMVESSSSSGSYNSQIRQQNLSASNATDGKLQIKFAQTSHFSLNGELDQTSTSWEPENTRRRNPRTLKKKCQSTELRSLYFSEQEENEEEEGSAEIVYSNCNF